MRLVPNWRRVVRHAWSIRLNLAVALASAIDAAVGYLVDGRLSASLIVAVASLAASGLRLVRQETVSGGDHGE